MKNILIIGAGLSTYNLVEYLKEQASLRDWKIVIADKSIETAKLRANSHPNVKATSLDVSDDSKRKELISAADVVVSMLPAHMHTIVAEDCILEKKHMVTASYISKEMKDLNSAAINAGSIILNEIGLDPGIDHLSAKKVLDKIKAEGGKMLIFESFTGGLLAPQSDTNPWNYKFTWNPRNVVLAGSGAAVKFKQEGLYKYIPYHQLFRRTEPIYIDGYGSFEGYANRDSLGYRDVYGLEDIPTIFRGTLRKPGFCRSWDVFVKLGMTDDSYCLENSENMSYRDFTNTFLAYNPNDSVELKLMHYLNIPQDSDLVAKLDWLGMFSSKKVGIKNASPAQILQHILEQKWSLEPDDKDMIVMYHKFGYEINGQKKMLESSMVTEGKSQQDTAMARTVGLPVAIAVKQIMIGNIKTPGVQIPISQEIYEPMLEELEEFGIRFIEKEIEYKGY